MLAATTIITMMTTITGPGTAEYVRLGLMGVIVVASLTSWWRPFMDHRVQG